MRLPQAELEISKSAALHNFKYFRSLLKDTTKILVLVKSNSYGHGGVEFARLMLEAGADYLGIATLEEGVIMRKAGITAPILALSTGCDCYSDIIQYDLEPGIPSVEYLNKLKVVLRSLGIKHYPIHIKLDTGMHRLGFEKDEIPALMKALEGCEEVRVKSIYSHLAASDEPRHDAFTLSQIELYNQLCAEIESSLEERPMHHILNSAGAERFTQYQMDMVRIGIGMYGISAVGSEKVKPVASLKCPVLQVKEISEGTVGYGRRGELTHVPTKIATIRIGYGDGVDRRLGYGNASFMVNGRLAPTIGSICMDMCMLDVTGIDVKAGDIVTVFGDNPTVQDLAKILETIPYEILTGIDRRLERVIVK
ncbi:MAG: alanine racemase [Bacteroidales bacterium]|nr:alanine racemase [Bacteroidales bacterium]